MKRVAISCAALLWTGGAWAEAIVRARVSPQVVELGDTFTLTVEATTDEDTRVSSPAPGKTKPFKLVGRSAATELNQVTVVNGQMERRTGISASYRLQATKEGIFTIGPASADIGGIVSKSALIKVKVVKAGQGPKRSSDPFFNFFGDDDPFGSLRPTQPEEKPAADPSLALSKADAPYLFYRFNAPKLKVVVGELVSAPLYEYEDLNAPRMVPEEITDPKASDFVIRAFDAKTKDLGITRVGQEPWKVALVRRWVLAPLRAGRATISSFRVRLLIGGQQAVRDTGPLVIEVTEPPIKGRPPGYELGVVGQFVLSAQVAPRAIDQGGVVTLSIELSGTGNLPAKLTMPSQSGIEFSDPEMKDDLKLDDKGRFGGTRRFTYAVRIARAGQVALGKVALPFFDAIDASYKNAEVDLGNVDVKGAAVASGLAQESPSKLASLPEPRAALEGGASRQGGSLLGFGALAFSGPGVLGLVGLFVRVRRWSRERRPRSDLPAGRLAAALSSLDAAKAVPSLADAAITRVVEAAIELHLGIHVRGLSSDAMRADLEEAGAPSAIVTDAVALVRASEAARFSPGKASAEDQKGRIERAEHLASALNKVRR